MRNEKITLYSCELDDNVEKEYVIYKRNELLSLIENGDVDLSDYSLDVCAPSNLKIDALHLMSETDEFFIIDEAKTVVLYMD